jgi:hypothetical protein
MSSTDTLNGWQIFTAKFDCLTGIIDVVTTFAYPNRCVDF